MLWLFVVLVWENIFGLTGEQILILMSLTFRLALKDCYVVYLRPFLTFWCLLSWSVRLTVVVLMSHDLCLIGFLFLFPSMWLGWASSLLLMTPNNLAEDKKNLILSIRNKTILYVCCHFDYVSVEVRLVIYIVDECVRVHAVA